MTTGARQHSTLTVGGARLEVAVEGEGQPILLVMGIGASLKLWRPFVKALVPMGYQTITFDLPGAGGSAPVWPPLRMRGLADLACGVLDRLSIPRAHVLGYSFGGAVAQEMAYRQPDRVDRLVLAATIPGLGSLPGRPTALIHMTTPMRYWSPRYAAKIAGSLYGGAARNNPLRPAVLVSGHPDRPSILGYVGQLSAITGWTSLPWLHRIPQPTLVLTGDDDPIIPTINGRLLAALIPGAELHIAKSAGHLYLLDHSRPAAAIIDRFLTDRSRP